MTLLPILAFSFVLSIVLILFSSQISFSPAERGRIVLLFAASLVYLAVFVFIGILVSSRPKTSVTSLVLSLFFWVFFVFLIPNASADFAASFVRVESRDNLDRVLADLDRQRDAAMRQAYKNHRIPEGLSCWYCNGSTDGRFETYGNDRVNFEFIRRQAEISVPIRLEYADRRWSLQKSYLDSLVRQARLGERLSLGSPAGVFRAVASAVCRSDLGSHLKRMDAAREYRETFICNLRAKNIFSSYAWITPADPSTFRTEDELVAMRTGGEFRTSQDYTEWREKQRDMWAAFQKLFTVKLPGDGPQDFPYLDVSDMLRFPDQPPGLFSGLEDSVLGVGVLIAEIVLLFYLGYVAFLWFDVR